MDQLALAAASVGQRLSIRMFLVGEPVRDAGHLRLLARLRARLPAGLPWGVEVPLPTPGALRALDDRRIPGERGTPGPRTPRGPKA